MFLGDLFNDLRKVGFGPGLLDGLVGHFNRLLDRRIERLLVLFSHDPRLLAQWGHTLAIRTSIAAPQFGPRECLRGHAVMAHTLWMNSLYTAARATTKIAPMAAKTKKSVRI